MTDIDEPDDNTEVHGWNRRHKKNPSLFYLVLVGACAVIAWVLSSVGHG